MSRYRKAKNHPAYQRESFSRSLWGFLPRSLHLLLPFFPLCALRSFVRSYLPSLFSLPRSSSIMPFPSFCTLTHPTHRALLNEAVDEGALRRACSYGCVRSSNEEFLREWHFWGKCIPSELFPSTDIFDGGSSFDDDKALVVFRDCLSANKTVDIA